MGPKREWLSRADHRSGLRDRGGVATQGDELAYVVTAKGSAATRDSIRSFRPHLSWAAVGRGC